MSCRECHWLQVESDRDGKVRIRKHGMYRCDAPIEAPKWPLSVTQAYGYRFPPLKTRMAPDDGDGCPTFQGRKGRPSR